MAHTLERVGLAADLGEPGGGRTIARCSCGWRSRAALTASLALSDLDAHLGLKPDVVGAA
jgi:hypothetical protein